MKRIQIILSALVVILFFLPWIKVNEEFLEQTEKTVKRMSDLISTHEQSVEGPLPSYDPRERRMMEAKARLSSAQIDLEIWNDLDGLSGYDLASDDPWITQTQAILFLVPFLAFVGMLAKNKFFNLIYPLLSFACLWYAYKDSPKFHYDIAFWCLNADLFLIFALGIAMPMPLSRTEKRTIERKKIIATFFGISATDSAFKPFGGFGTLSELRQASIRTSEKLDLRGRGISNVEQLMKLTSLKELYLGGNPLTEEQVKRLSEALPGCRIDFSVPRQKVPKPRVPQNES
jgi:hypothetical protein